MWPWPGSFGVGPPGTVPGLEDVLHGAAAVVGRVVDDVVRVAGREEQLGVRARADAAAEDGAEALVAVARLAEARERAEVVARVRLRVLAEAQVLEARAHVVERLADEAERQAAGAREGDAGSRPRASFGPPLPMRTAVDVPPGPPVIMKAPMLGRRPGSKKTVETFTSFRCASRA